LTFLPRGQKVDFVFPFTRDYTSFNVKKVTTPYHTFGLSVDACATGGSWTGDDIWRDPTTFAQPLAPFVSLLNLPNLTEPLLMKSVLAWLQPRLEGNGESKFRDAVNAAKVDGTLVLTQPKQHLWFDLWTIGQQNKSPF
jgi:hypothetical protein